MERFFTYVKGSVYKARRLRREMTDAERILWNKLRNDQLGAHFRRQAPVGPYIVDFICIKRDLVVELDGSQHETPAARNYDEERTAYLECEGLHVLRFSNKEVMGSLDSVLQKIREAMQAFPSKAPEKTPM